MTKLEKHRAYMRMAVKRLREQVYEAIKQHKVKMGCYECGYNKNHAALQFDHVVARNKTGEKYKRPENWTTFEKLINDSNVRVLCANCHCIKTHEHKDHSRGA